MCKFDLSQVEQITNDINAGLYDSMLLDVVLRIKGRLYKSFLNKNMEDALRIAIDAIDDKFEVEIKESEYIYSPEEIQKGEEIVWHKSISLFPL